MNVSGCIYVLCIYVCMYIYVCMNVFFYMYVGIYVFVCVRDVCILCMYVCMYVCMPLTFRAQLKPLQLSVHPSLFLSP